MGTENVESCTESADQGIHVESCSEIADLGVHVKALQKLPRGFSMLSKPWSKTKLGERKK
jgi:hypothetical protein